MFENLPIRLLLPNPNINALEWDERLQGVANASSCCQPFFEVSSGNFVTPRMFAMAMAIGDLEPKKLKIFLGLTVTAVITGKLPVFSGNDH